MCHYTLRVLPNALMIRFIFAEDPISEKKWFVPEGFIDPTRHGRGYWLSCQHKVIQSFIEEKKYRKIDRNLSIRIDLADHIITLFSIRIHNQLKALTESQLRLKHEEQLGMPLMAGDSLTHDNNVVGAVLDFNTINKDVEYPKISPLNNYNSEVEAIPSYPLLKLIEFGVYKLMLSLPLIQGLQPNSPNSSFKIEVLISKESTPLLCSLYRLSSYLNNK
ncbi:hypothetical protein DSO57_1005299 [Entomophthora muscae]|uniref:Uncharacterized protein n=1 Tax=Entomophthora muscae TaxID=34485 RepID=A0ACC2UHS4_9FUNG|nr:hypothetical protein DSO57_1005299 [Entomophthora muscae]